MSANIEVLTHSRIQSFKRCRRRHWFEYEIGMRPSTDAKALRMGTAYHDGLEQLHQGNGITAAIQAAWASYENTPANSPAFDDTSYGWGIEYETVARLLSGYDWYWTGQSLEFITVEMPFRIPLRNPKSNRASRRFTLAGKIDGIVRLRPDSDAVAENKLLGESLDSDSSLWRRLRIDQQVSIYLYAARQLGANVDTVLYNVTRKPTIRPEKVPLLDKEGLKVVLDTNGERVMTKQGTPRQTGDTSLGYVLQSRPMLISEWGDKLTEDIAARPNFYYARREVPRTDDEIASVVQELWELSQTIGDAQKHNRWYRTVTHDTCQFCPFYGPCTEGFHHPSDPVPEGFEYVANVHPELGDHRVQAAPPTTANGRVEPAETNASDCGPAEIRQDV